MEKIYQIIDKNKNVVNTIILDLNLNPDFVKLAYPKCSYKELISNISWDDIKKQRDELLNKSDIDVLKCIENNASCSIQLKNYRQALRDIPQKYTDANSIVWPIKK